jgi:Ca-activated chloride channel family protein
MTFEHAWVLAFLALPLGWALWEWNRSPRKLGLLLKALALAAIVAAIAQPRITVPETKVAAALLVDTSASMTAGDLTSASQIAKNIESARGRHWSRVIPFARNPRELTPGEQGRSFDFKLTAGADGRATDLEAAVRDAVAALPTGMVPRVVLISDGNENHGSIARAAWVARQLQIPIDTYAVAGHSRPNLAVESVSFPALAFTGEKFPIDIVVNSPSKTEGTVELTAEGKVLGNSPVSLQRGSNQLRVHASVNVAGAVDISGAVKTSDYGTVRFERALTLKRPRLLYYSQDPAGTEAHFLDTLAAARFDVQRSSDASQGSLAGYQLVILNNWDLESLPPARKGEFEDFVKQGGGLLVIGGEHNVYAENKKTEDAMDRVLPAKLAPPRSPEGTSVVLIIDKSSSMEGRKMELARMAAIGVIENLRPVDLVGVLIFDNSFQWAVPIRRAEDRSLIKRLVAGITPDGGTQIAPALSEAFRKILPSKATYKHIVLLTDGISEEGDSMSLSKEAASQKVTISTVGLGQDVNRAYLEKVATFAKGKSYFLSDPSGLEQILLKDVMEHTGSTAIEKPIVPAVAKPTDVLAGIDMKSAPPLRGYVKFIAKPTADTILMVDEKDPLLTEWQLGLGRSAVFASDAKSRWAEKWIGWNGFDKFWVNLCRDLLPRSQTGETSVTYDSASGKLMVDYRLAGDVKEPPKIPEIFAFGPNGFQKPIPVKKSAEGVYHGELAIGNRDGLFRIRPLEDSRIFPETGLYRDEEELTEFGSNEALLRQVSSFTGGRFNPDPSSVFDAGGKSVAGTLQLWPGLLGLAIILNLIELIVRKWRGIVDTMRGPSPATA